jgi:hypothetical protein
VPLVPQVEAGNTFIIDNDGVIIVNEVRKSKVKNRIRRSEKPEFRNVPV